MNPKTSPRLRTAAGVALALAFALTALPALARDFVQDQAGMFSAGTVSALNARLGRFTAQTQKEVVVLTVPSLGGQTLQSAATAAFQQQNVNGVLIYIARDDRQDIILPDRAGVQAGWFTTDVVRSIRTAMEAQFKSGNYDAGINGAVDAILNIYRAHVGSLRGAGSANGAQSGGNGGVPAVQRTSAPSTGGFNISMLWWIIIAVLAFFVLRSIFRAFSAQRYGGGYPPPGGIPPGGMPPGGYGQGYGPGGPGYGGPGFGGGGGGSFWSGLLGGLGGAWLGNELFRGGGGASQIIEPAQAAQVAPPDTSGWSGGDSGAGWQNDAGQADAGGASSGDWSGGGFGGDSGGGWGGGGDFGGGGGDSGGGW